jgi:hypothetical protein
MKIKLIGWRFAIVEEIQVETQKVLNTLTKKHLQNTFQKCQKYLDRSVGSQRDCFEGDGTE